MRRPREPLTLVLVGLCVAWTLVAKWRHLSYSEAGALTGFRLWQGEYWRLFTATALHHMGSWIHLVVNGVSLFFLGRVVERGCGRAPLLACVFGAALAGFASSLVFDPEPAAERMGISGGIAGLIGLVLAVEWAMSRGPIDFLRQRNTILVAFFLALGFPLALVAEWLVPGTHVDHLGHLGGFGFGLLMGLALYTKTGVRPVRGAVAALALSIAPVAYASHPVLDADYQVWQARRAYGRRDLDAAAKGFERAREIDPAALDRNGVRDLLLDAYLRLAVEHLGEAEGERLLAAARALGGRSAAPWARFAEEAEAREHPDEAYAAWREAALLLPPSAAWLPLGRALRLLRARGSAPLRETVEVARGAARALAADLPPEALASLEKEIADTAERASRAALEASSGKEAAEGLADLYRTLAENAAADARRPHYRLRSAEWLWRATDGPIPSDDVTARFRAAITESALYGDPATAEAAARWFRERGMAVPEPDLEGEEDGG